MASTSCLEIAQSMVRIPSVNPNYDPSSAAELEMTRWIEAWGREHGFKKSKLGVCLGVALLI